MTYFETVKQKLEKVNSLEQNNMTSAAKLVADAIEKDGLIYIFGCGHSHLIAEDCFYRAGGLANVYPIFDEKLMLHESASYSSVLEKDEKSVDGILNKYNITENDVLFVISTSGKNGSPVQMALDGKKKGVKVIGIGSSAYFNDAPKHSSGKKLVDVADVFIDNRVPHGDAVCDIGLNGVKSAPISTAITSFIMQNVIVEAERIAIKNGATPSVFMSGNVDGGAEYNKSLIEKYKKRVDCL